MDIKPKTIFGKVTEILSAMFFILFGLFLMFVHLGERGGATFFSNLKLTLPFMFATISGSASFFTALYSIIWSDERSVLVYLSAVIGLVVFLWMLGEILFPH